jgi:hypothetical protein
VDHHPLPNDDQAARHLGDRVIELLDLRALPGAQPQLTPMGPPRRYDTWLREARRSISEVHP